MSPAKALPLLAAVGRERVQDLREPCGPALFSPASPAGSSTETAVIPRIDAGNDEHVEHRHLDLARLDLLAEVFRRAADHQAGDEHREHDHHEHAVEPGADAAEHHLAELHVDERHEPAERRERVVHRVDAAARRVGRHGRVERGVRDAEAHLLPFHVAARIASRSPTTSTPRAAWIGLPRASAQYAVVTPAKKSTNIAAHTRPAVLLVRHHPAEHVRRAPTGSRRS